MRQFLIGLRGRERNKLLFGPIIEGKSLRVNTFGRIDVDFQTPEDEV
jgi:hypothetical protein